MLEGGGNFGSIFNNLANMKQINKLLPSCIHCMNSMKDESSFLIKVNKYEKCVSWNVIQNSELIKYKPPDHYISTVDLKPKCNNRRLQKCNQSLQYQTNE